MDLLSDTESKFNVNLNELVKETFDQAYQDEVKMYTDILAYYANQEHAGTSTAHKSKRHTKTVPKLIKTTDKSNRSIHRNYVLTDENMGEIPHEFEESLNKKIKSKRYSHSIHKFEYYKKIDPPGTCSKNGEQPACNKKQDAGVNTSDSEPKYVEKMTYCRPVLTMHNQEFIYKTMERNIKLQQLVRQLVEARAREKDHEAWNNYINELRNKHRYQFEVDQIQKNSPEDTNPEIIDYYNTKFTWKQSNRCQNLLQDFYSASNVNNNVNDSNNRYSRNYGISNYQHYNYQNDSHCYPTASQGRLMMTKNQRRVYQPPRYYNGNTIIVEKEYDQYLNRPQLKRNIFHEKRNLINVLKSLAVQTDSILFEKTIKQNEEQGTFKEKYNLIQSNVERLKQKITKNAPNKDTLSTIENKLDTLIETVNTFLSELKTKRVSTSEKSAGSSLHRSLADQLTEIEKQRVNYLKSDIVCGVVQEKPCHGCLTKDSIDKILSEELNKSDKVKRDIEELLHNPQNPCAVKIMFDIPTKERSTEVTDSICTTVPNPRFTVEEVCSPDTDRMTIAVNTEPLGILALIRVSTETVKQLLSYMPQIDYCSYLSRLQFNQVAQRPRVPSFECNICGASFERPSLLSDHIIQQHNLVNTRDCCVCRHVIDTKQHRPALFKCRHCGQRFTRAYCRELHEQECAIKMGRLHDISPSLMILS